MVREVDDMADDDPQVSLGHRHAHRPAGKGGRKRVLLIAVGVLVLSVIVVGLVVWTGNRSGDAVADRTAAAPAASTTSASLPATTPAPTPSETATTPEVPSAFVDAMQQIGIPLDPHTGWDVAQGICVRLGQPEYDRFRMAEGVERLFPSVSDDQAHAFVAMVAESVCHL
jgi:hypothetical protein